MPIHQLRLRINRLTPTGRVDPGRHNKGRRLSEAVSANDTARHAAEFIIETFPMSRYGSKLEWLHATLSESDGRTALLVLAEIQASLDQ
jgi:hypothetical protein